MQNSNTYYIDKSIFIIDGKKTDKIHKTTTTTKTRYKMLKRLNGTVNYIICNKSTYYTLNIYVCVCVCNAVRILLHMAVPVSSHRYVHFLAWILDA